MGQKLPCAEDQGWKNGYWTRVIIGDRGSFGVADKAAFNGRFSNRGLWFFGCVESGFEVSSFQSVIRSGGRQGLGDNEH